MNLALFDFDGTITDTDSFTQFILYAASKKRVRFRKFSLLPTIAKYKLGRLHGREVRALLYRLAFQGVSEQHIRQKGEQYANFMIPTFIKDNAMQKIHWHQKQGDTVVVVSASLDIYLKPWCEKHGLALICTEVEAIDGVLTGAFLQGDCSSFEKKRRVEAAYNLTDYNQIYAYGDTPEDTELLSLAATNQRFYRYF